MAEASRVFPQARFVAMVRHPGAVSASLHDRFHYDWPKAVGHWVRSNLELLHRGDLLGDRLAVCRYEDLVLDPEPVLRELLEWLDEPWSPRVLEHNVVHTERGTPAKVEGHTKSSDPIDTSRISKWTSVMDEEGYRVLRTRADVLARFFGYTVDDASSIEPLQPATSHRDVLLTGDDLVKRQAALGTTNWGKWPSPSLANQLLKPSKFEVVVKASKKSAPKKRPVAPSSAASRSTPARAPSGAVAKVLFKKLPRAAQGRLKQSARKVAEAVARW